MDLAKLFNMEGGIDGEPVEVVVRDHGNEPQRGIEYYSRISRDGAFVFDTLSEDECFELLLCSDQGKFREVKFRE